MTSTADLSSTSDLTGTATARHRPGGTAGIIARYAGWDLRRNIRMFESTFFIIMLPAALYLVFGAMSGFGDLPVGHGNVAAYSMVSIALYGAVTAMTAIAGSAAIERQRGWGRQLGLTNLSGAGYLTGKTLVGLGMAVLPIVVVFVVGAVTGARFDQPWRWGLSGALILLGALPFALYGLAAALLFRSEAAISAASGLMVVLAFFGNLFVPLSGVLLDIARFTPLYGSAALARWPMLGGEVIDVGAGAQHDPLWWVLANVVTWTVIFGLLCAGGARRRTGRA